MSGRQEGHCLETWNEFLPLQRGEDVLSQPVGTDVMTRLSSPPLGIVCFTVWKETYTKYILGEKKTKKPTNIYVVEQSRLPAHLACKRLQAPNQLSTWVYNTVKPLKKIMSSRSKSKGGNGVWEGRKINFALSPEKGWEREFVHNMCVASIENRNEIQDQRQKLAFLLWPRVVCLRSVCYRRKPSGGRVGKGSKYQKYTGDAALTGGPWAALEILLKKTALSEDIISSALP